MRYLYLFLLSISTVIIYAQGEANVWYFGSNAGLDFNTSPPTALLDGQINTPEGCSSISDANGGLLFYTDGRTVWDKEHNIMPNGDYFGGTGLHGDPSSTQSGLIVPHPTEANIYFVFTVDEPHHENAFAYPNQGPALPNGTPMPTYQDVPTHTVPEDDDGFNNGLNYSVVDMNLRDGLGDIVQNQRNIHLITYDENDPEEIKYQCSEKITAVVGADCESIWLITHFIDHFYAFKIDENGVEEEPVISNVSPVLSINNYRRASIGYLKASPDGKKLASATVTSTYNQQGTTDAGDGHVYMYDFDDETGEVSNSSALINNVRAYGVEFSPDSKKIYATLDQVQGGTTITSILQWDLEAEIVNQSQFSFPGVGLAVGTALQLAPDGKIYVSAINQSKLNVINNPNQAGFGANYTEFVDAGAIDLNGRLASFGLPPFIQSFFTSNVNLLPEDGTTETVTGSNYYLCEGEEVTFGFEADGEASYVWYKNDEIITEETSPFITKNFEDSSFNNQTESYRLEVFPETGECKISGLINLTFAQIVTPNEVDLVNCTFLNNEANSNFDLTEALESLVEEDVDLDDFEFSFFLDEELTQEINDPTNFESLSDENQVYVSIEDLESRCTYQSTINLVLDFAGEQEIQLESCNDNDNQNGEATFNLEEINNQIENLTPFFYETLEDAFSESNPITEINQYTSSATTVYARIFNSETCDGLLNIRLEVIDLPDVEENQLIYYCVEDFPTPITLTSGLSANNSEEYAYFWLPNEETSPNIEVSEAGQYEVFVQDLNTGCENSTLIDVVNSDLTDFSLKTTSVSSNNTIEVIIPAEALGDYEFALGSAAGPYQEAKIFEGLEPGDYQVFVRDKNGCGITSRTTTIIGVMTFFTPNGDGINDVWGLRGNRPGIQDRAEISVFDRFGKLLYQFSGADSGWDGNYNGKPMPSNDYWYQVELEDGRVVKGNFTLKR